MYENDLYYSAVVRIRSIRYIFNWLEPYKKDNSVATGSGFFINSEGYILTNSHVVNQAIKLYITISIEGNKEFEATIICIHPELDLALIKIIDYKNKFHFKLGDSNLINVGQRVIALGFPLGCSTLKLTDGVISGFENRLIQTDTPINPGNSGGPLLNTDNYVIGINSSGISGVDIENIGFSIPINVYINIKDNFLKEKILYLPKIGIICERTSEILHEFYNLNKDNNSGVIVTKNFIKDSEIEINDIILEIENYKIDNKGEILLPHLKEKINFVYLLDKYNIKDEITLKYWSVSKNKECNTKTRLVSENSIYKFKLYTPMFEKIEYEIFAGCVFMKFTENHYNLLFDMLIDYYNYNRIGFEIIINLLNQYNSLDKDKELIIITHIFSDSFLAKQQMIYRGMIIDKINNKKINSLKDLTNAFCSPINKHNKTFILIKTTTNKEVICDLKTIIEEENIFTTQYNYSLTKIGTYYNSNFKDTKKKSIKKEHDIKKIKSIKKENP
jgi:S1-C subfamily serine protease